MLPMVDLFQLLQNKCTHIESRLFISQRMMVDRRLSERIGLFSSIGRQLFHAGVMSSIHPTFDNKRIVAEMLGRMVLIMAYSHFLYAEISLTLERRIHLFLSEKFFLLFFFARAVPMIVSRRSLVRLLKY